MKISIITATWNRVDFIDKCLESVEKQTYRNIEHIFVDAYSTDGTVEHIKEYIKKNKDITCKFIQSKPKGIANAMNIGIKNATGDVIHILHSDDYYLNETSLERANAQFEKNKDVKWLIGSLGIEYKGTRLIIKYKYLLELGIKTLTGVMLVPHENTFIKRSVFDEYGMFRKDLKVTMDYDYWIRLLQDETPTIVNECYAVFIIHKGSMSSNPKNWIRVLEEKLKVLKEYKTMPLIGNVEDTEIYKTYKDIQDFVKKLTNPSNQS